MTEVLVLPGGHKVRIEDGETREHAFWRHAAMSLPEGLCPIHQTALERVRSRRDDVVASGHCRECRAYWMLTRRNECSWDIDHDPHRGDPMIPEWVEATWPS